MENILLNILSAYSHLISLLQNYIFNLLSELKYVFQDTINYDLKLRNFNLDFMPLCAAVTSLIVPIVFVNIIYTLCVSKSHSNLQQRRPDDNKTINTYLYESLRWFRQAEYDLQAAKYDLEQEEPASEWSCFKCQQAAEKAVKSVLIALGLTHSPTAQGHNLYDSASVSQDRHLIRIASSLQGVFGHVGRMRYPDQLPYPKVPHDVYSKATAENSIGLTETLLNHVRSKYLKPPHLVDNGDEKLED